MGGAASEEMSVGICDKQSSDEPVTLEACVHDLILRASRLGNSAPVVAARLGTLLRTVVGRVPPSSGSRDAAASGFLSGRCHAPSMNERSVAEA